MIEIPFVKYQATGNDFVLIEDGTAKGVDIREVAKAMCHRCYGVGADGLIVWRSLSNESVRMGFFNPDGTTDVCGNGMRCVALHSYKKNPFQKLTIETKAGAATVSANEGGKIFSVTSPILEAPVKESVTLDTKRFDGYLVNTGTPHFVVFIEGALTDDHMKWGSLIEHHPHFPEPVNCDFVSISKNDISIRIWERSVGETLSCGTGASASALAAHQFKGLPSTITVHCRGGDLTVGVAEPGVFTLSGEAKAVFDGRYTW